MPYAFVLTATFPVTANEVYEAWLDSRSHSAMTGGEAIMSDALGDEVSAWDGYITGRNVELVPGRRIVQSWRTDNFTDEQADSIVSVTLEDAPDGGTLLTLIHSNVPDDQRSYEEGGWQTHYFEPMQEYFGRLRAAGAAVPAKAGRRQAEPAATTRGVKANGGKAGGAKLRTAAPKPKSRSKSKARSKAQSRSPAKSKAAAKAKRPAAKRRGPKAVRRAGKKQKRASRPSRRR